MSRLLCLLLSVAPAAGQRTTAWKIDAFGSSSPDFLGGNATIMDNDGATALQVGTNGWTCMPANPRGMADNETGWIDAHEAMPVCFDDKGMQWMTGWLTDSAPVMDRDSWMWMLNGDMGEDNTVPGVLLEVNATAGQWIESGPHLMLMPKDPSALAAFPTNWSHGEPYVMFAGSDYAHLMIPYEDYYQYTDGVHDVTLTEPEGAHTTDEWKIWAFSTAAPTHLAHQATVLDNDGATPLRNGTNGWTCMPANPRGMADNTTGWATPHEAMPICIDSVGFQWLAGYMAGTVPVLDRDTFGWMLHGDMGEDNTQMGILNQADATEGQWIESGPHLMLFPKDTATLEDYTTDWSTGEPYVMFKGSDYAHLMIPAPGYYAYTDPSSYVAVVDEPAEAAETATGSASVASLSVGALLFAAALKM